MNATVYLFGEFDNGYTQYPDDCASVIFKKFYANAKSTTQVAIHRDGDLMYYGYIRKLEHDRYIGLCVIINGLFLNRIDALFPLFENTISSLVTKGQLIHFNEQGEITSNIRKLYAEKEEIDLLTESLCARFNSFDNYTERLPTVSYDIDKDSVKNFTVDDNLEGIIESSYRNGYTYVYKSKGFNTTQMNSYEGVLTRISNENSKLKKENAELQEKLVKTQRQKKQIRKVVFLVFIVVICGIGIYFLYNNLYWTQAQLYRADEIIMDKDSLIDSMNKRITSLKISIDSIRAVCNVERTRRTQIEKQVSEICELNPFFVTKCKIYRDELSFDYYALEDKKIVVTLKIINEKNAEIVSYDYNITIHKGNGLQRLIFSDKLDSSNYYYIIFMYNGRVVAGERWYSNWWN